MRISDIAKEERELAVEFGQGVVLNIVYRNSKLSFADMTATVRNASRAAEATGDGASMADRLEASAKALIDPLLESLVSWDLTDDDEAAIPITHDGLSSVPYQILVDITRAMQGDQRADGGKAR